MDENITNESGIATNDTEEQILADALSEFNKAQGIGEATASDQSETKVEEQKTEEQKVETAEVPEQPPQPDKQPEAKAPEATGTATPPEKPFYTPDEIEAELKEHGDLARLDSSRLSPEGKLIQVSMQRGFTPKLQEAAALRKDFDRLLQEKTALEAQRLKEENERKYQEEVEKYGEEQAVLMKEVREYKNRVELMEQRDREREQLWQQEQTRIAAESFRQQFSIKAPSFNIPVTQEMEDIVMSRVWSENQRRKLAGRDDFITIDDGLKLVSDTIGFSNVDSIKKILNANPKAMEALENEWKTKYSQQKNAGPTIIKSSGAGGSGAQVPKTTPDKPDPKIFEDPNYDVAEDIKKLSLTLLEEELKKI